mmetsp:Transcript_46038/g.96683  ORF Transcript_46038/g.96683 Transcript_46038/m.96683 type:complete len:223 (+) Transcript_46038:419-1087(+)
MLMQYMKLLLSTHACSLGNKKTKLTQHIGCDTHRCFVAPMATYCNEQRRSGITLKVSLRMIGHNLNYSVPNGITDVISANGNQFEDCIDIPTKICGVFLREDGNLEHHFLANARICHDQVRYQLVHNSLGVVRIANDKQQIQCSPSYANVGIFEGYQYRSLVFLCPIDTPLNLSQLCHGHESQVTDIGFADGYELSQELHCPLSHYHRACCPPGHNQIDRLK